MRKNFVKIFVVIALLLSLCLSFCSCDIDNMLSGTNPDDSSQGGSSGDNSSGNNGNGDDSTDNNQSGGNTNGGNTDSGSTDNNGDEGDNAQGGGENEGGVSGDGNSGQVDSFDLSQVPEFSGSNYAVINNNIPFFTEAEKVTTSYERYDDRDSLGRCTLAMACIGVDLMPTSSRGNISSVIPTGWVQKEYSCIPQTILYNRSHLIAFSLTGENANRENLITGTSFMNQIGMTQFENMVADYLKENTSNHVMYRVTPIFEGNNLLASGVLMEAFSVEDNGEGICFNVYMYNVQPGVIIDYATGESRAESSGNDTSGDEIDQTVPADATYILNIKKKTYHKISHYEGNLTANMEYTNLTKEEIEALGYKTCGICKP